ncbi:MULTISPECIES: dual specificity protein phosphatase family protein [Cysteiniphilum]|uniref:dual specificity protein phosphatase family protein n=1 Tax=Cysteiniphilum TaxID=2056696 RepID=UPI001786B714|nr:MULTISPECIES: dual specificity protein phosphatase [Cysteiniphilum]
MNEENEKPDSRFKTRLKKFELPPLHLKGRDVQNSAYVSNELDGNPDQLDKIGKTGIYIGPYHALPEALQKGVKYIINVGNVSYSGINGGYSRYNSNVENSAELMAGEINGEVKREVDGTQILYCPAFDNPSQSIEKYFQSTKQFIDDARAKGSEVFVHCHQGISRSSSIVVAYLMQSDLYPDCRTVDGTLAFIRQHRPCVAPNIGFYMELTRFEKMYTSLDDIRIADYVEAKCPITSKDVVEFNKTMNKRDELRKSLQNTREMLKGSIKNIDQLNQGDKETLFDFYKFTHHKSPLSKKENINLHRSESKFQELSPLKSVDYSSSYHR